jgi:hypothetical protein
MILNKWRWTQPGTVVDLKSENALVAKAAEGCRSPKTRGVCLRLVNCAERPGLRQPSGAFGRDAEKMRPLKIRLLHGCSGSILSGAPVKIDL